MRPPCQDVGRRGFQKVEELIMITQWEDAWGGQGWKKETNRAERQSHEEKSMWEIKERRVKSQLTQRLAGHSKKFRIHF